MSKEPVLELYDTIEQSVQLLSKELNSSYLESLAETLQNIHFDGTAQQIDGLPTDETVKKLNGLYSYIKTLPVSVKDFRKAIQFNFLQAIKTDAIQPNHYITPDTIASLMAYFIGQLTNGAVSMLDICAGAGNLLTQVVEELKERCVGAVGVEFDDVLVSILAMSTALQKQNVTIKHQDGVMPLLMDKVDIVISDLPIGYYPNNDIAKEFRVAVNNEQTYAHHLLMENALNHLSDNGWAFFVTPSNLFETPQAPSILKLLTENNYNMQAFLTLPKTLFKQGSTPKAILIIQKHGEMSKKADQVLLGEIPSFKDAKAIQQFVDTFNQWAKQFKMKK